MTSLHSPFLIQHGIPGDSGISPHFFIIFLPVFVFFPPLLMPVWLCMGFCYSWMTLFLYKNFGCRFGTSLKYVMYFRVFEVSIN